MTEISDGKQQFNCKFHDDDGVCRVAWVSIFISCSWNGLSNYKNAFKRDNVSDEVERSNTIDSIQISDIHVWKPPNKSYGVRQITLWVPPSTSYGGRQINIGRRHLKFCSIITQNDFKKIWCHLSLIRFQIKQQLWVLLTQPNHAPWRHNKFQRCKTLEHWSTVTTVKFEIGLLILVIHRKEYGLTDVVSNEGLRPSFDTIAVRSYSFRRITYVNHWKLLTKQLS